MASYDNVGNVNGYSDSTDAGTASIMGTWAFQYDALNRLVTGTSGATTGPYANMKLCWSYDRGPHGQVFVRGVEDRGPHGQVFVRGVEDDFGNRIIENVQTGACSTAGSVASTLVFNAGVPADRSSSVGWNAQNQLTGVIPPGGGGQSPSTLLYDSAGDVTSDSSTGNQYVYDAEGRICAFQTEVPVDRSSSTGWQTPNGLGGTIMMGYLYDAEGARVAKGTITTMSCDPATNGFTMTGNNTGTYVLGPGGEELTQLSGSGAWQRTNVFGGGKQLATYDSMGLHFQIEDALGTRRMQTNADGQPETDIQSLPYGDALVTANDQYAPATADDATPLHFTGKERDTESGNDYFGARYYASSMGRFLSPDYVGYGLDPAPVPWADFTNPQSMNLYAYVRNNPLTNTDPDGNDCMTLSDQTSQSVKVTVAAGGSASTCGGTFVNGTVNMSSLTYNGQTGDVGYSFSNYADGSGSSGAGVTGHAASFNDSLFYNTFGPPSRPTWNAAAGAVSPKGVGAFYTASAAAATCVLFCAEAAALPNLASGLEARVIAYLESQGIPANKAAAYALKWLAANADQKFNGSPGYISSTIYTLKQGAAELNKIVREFHQSEGAH